MNNDNLPAQYIKKTNGLLTGLFVDQRYDVSCSNTGAGTSEVTRTQKKWLYNKLVAHLILMGIIFSH